MSDLSEREQAVELLQELGLKEYEAKCFVALSRLPQGTAKDISDISNVPRTRVYDAVRVLEAKGLVEVQHSNPQQFRAVGVKPAIGTLRAEYEDRTDRLRDALTAVEPADTDDDDEVTHEVWALSGQTSLTNRMEQLLGNADEEAVLVVGDEAVLSSAVYDQLRDTRARNVDIIVGTTDERLREDVEAELPEATVFVSGLEWLQPNDGDEVTISRMLLVDRDAILLATAHPSDDGADERGIFGRGFTNGLVVVTRRMLATGLPSEHKS